MSEENLYEKNHVRIFILLILFLSWSAGKYGGTYGGTKKNPPVKGKFIPPHEKILLLIGQDKDVIDSYTKEMKMQPTGIMFYTAIQDMKSFYGPYDPDGGGIQDFPYLLKHYPRAVIQIGLYMVGALDDVISGKLDGNIEEMAEILIKTQRPIYLRIGYEFDSPGNAYAPKKYVQAFQYIVDKFRRLKVDNVAYVWHSYAIMNPGNPIANWYPGDDYVDWVAISYFNPYNTDNMNVVAQFARDHGKPFMIAESTPAGFSTDKGEDTWKRWYGFLFKYIKEQNVKVLCYINCWWDKLPQFASFHWGDARIERNAVITRKWLENTRQKEFLQNSKELFKDIKDTP